MAAAAHLSEVLPPVTAGRPTARLSWRHRSTASSIARWTRPSGSQPTTITTLPFKSSRRSGTTRGPTSRLRCATVLLSPGRRCTAATSSTAGDLLQQAQMIAQSPRFDATDRAEVLYRRGCVALKQRGGRRRGRTLHTRARDERPLARAFASLWRRTRTSGARAATSSGATGRPRAATRNGRSSSPPQPATSARRRTRSSRPHSSPSASATGCSRATTPNRRSCCTRSTATRLRKRASSTTSAASASCSATSRRPKRSSKGRSTTADEAGSTPDLAQAVSSLAQVYLPTGDPREARVRAERAACSSRGVSTSSTSSATHSSSSRRRSRPRTTAKAPRPGSTRQSGPSRRSARQATLLPLDRPRRPRTRSDDLEAAAALYRGAARRSQDFHF